MLAVVCAATVKQFGMFHSQLRRPRACTAMAAALLFVLVAFASVWLHAGGTILMIRIPGDVSSAHIAATVAANSHDVNDTAYDLNGRFDDTKYDLNAHSRALRSWHPPLNHTSQDCTNSENGVCGKLSRVLSSFHFVLLVNVHTQLMGVTQRHVLQYFPIFAGSLQGGHTLLTHPFPCLWWCPPTCISAQTSMHRL
jgi:hypothetical protein